MNKRIILALLFILLIFRCSAQSINVKYPLIIDTDAAPDDLRAICLFTAINEIDILAITTCDGALAPENGLKKVANLIYKLNQKEIPVTAGRELKSPPPDWREFCKKIPWSDEKNINISVSKSAPELIIDEINKSDEPVTIICLGSLTNLYDALKTSSEIQSNIKKIIWYNKEIKPQPLLNPPQRGGLLAGSNYERDKKAAEFVFSTNLIIDVISNLDNKEAVFDEKLLRTIEKIETPYAKIISFSHRQPYVMERINNKHLKLLDDLIPVYFLYPELFDMEIITDAPNHYLNKNFNIKAIREKIPEILAQNYVLEKNIIFEKFPDTPELYRYDIRQHKKEIIKRHGNEEWKLCVLTSEFHRHLGIYSIIGAKMGLKAREIFNAEIDKLEVYSYAGSIPPISCLNDGLQISTGATLGYGTIKIATDSISTPEALFIYKNYKKKLRLKDEYLKQIKSDINQGIIKYGNLTSGYWKLIRELGIKYWLEWDRDEIFEVE